MLNKFNDNMKNNMSNLYKEVKYEKNKWSAKLDKLNNDAKRLYVIIMSRTRFRVNPHSIVA